MSIQIQKVATFDSDRKNQLIPNKLFRSGEHSL